MATTLTMMRNIANLLEALRILHPKKDVWVTPNDEQAEFIEQVISNADDLLSD